MVDQAGISAGRRTVTHEYPYRDLPYTEDMGRMRRGFKISAFVLGENYLAQADAVLAACEESGPGTLVHPTRGQMTVIAGPCELSEASDALNMAQLSLEFFEAGTRTYPAKAVDYTAQAATSAQTTRTVAGDAFRELYSTAGPAWLFTAAKGDFTSALEMVQAVAVAMPSPLDDDAFSEFLAAIDEALDFVDSMQDGTEDAAQAITDAISGLSDLGDDAVTASLELAGFGADYLGETASVYGGELDQIVSGTATRAVQAANRAATIDLVRSLALSCGVEAALNADYASKQAAYLVRDELLTALDAQITRAGDSAEYQRFNALRSLYVDTKQGFESLAKPLPSEKLYPVPNSPTPALVAAYDLYGDLSRVDEIVAANKIRNPGLLPGGESLVVLSA